MKYIDTYKIFESRDDKHIYFALNKFISNKINEDIFDNDRLNVSTGLYKERFDIYGNKHIFCNIELSLYVYQHTYDVELYKVIEDCENDIKNKITNMISDTVYSVGVNKGSNYMNLKMVASFNIETYEFQEFVRVNDMDTFIKISDIWCDEMREKYSYLIESEELGLF